MSTKIYTMTHKKFYPPNDPVYVPLHVGKAGKQDLGYLGDDTGDNISERNCYYGELTGLYWMWKNLEYEGNVGVCHYRRFFLDQDRKVMQEAEYDAILSEYDIITSQAMYIDEPYRDYFGEAHHIQDLEQEGEVIRELFPEDHPVFEQVMNGKKYYFGNLLVTSKKLFNEYCEWLFAIFEELENRIDVSDYDDYHKRIFGFLSEQLLLVWTTARGLRVYECKVGITQEKAETREFKLAIGQLLKQKQIREARQLFYEILQVRPDIRLEHSDLRGEIPLIEWILYICECEAAADVEGMLSYSLDLPTLIEHVKKVLELQKKERDLTPADRSYMQETNVSELMLEVLKRNAK